MEIMKPEKIGAKKWKAGGALFATKKAAQAFIDMKIEKLDPVKKCGNKWMAGGVLWNTKELAEGYHAHLREKQKIEKKQTRKDKAIGEAQKRWFNKVRIRQSSNKKFVVNMPGRRVKVYCQTFQRAIRAAKNAGTVWAFHVLNSYEGKYKNYTYEEIFLNKTSHAPKSKKNKKLSKKEIIEKWGKHGKAAGKVAQTQEYGNGITYGKISDEQAMNITKSKYNSLDLTDSEKINQLITRSFGSVEIFSNFFSARGERSSSHQTSSGGF